MSRSLQKIDTSALEPHEFNRHLYRQNTPTERFIDDIKENGIVSPIAVTSANKILDGTRRYLAAKEIESIDKVPVRVINTSDRYEERSLILALNDDRDETFEQKVRVAIEYKQQIGPKLQERQKKGKSIEHLDDDPAKNFAAGEKAETRKLVADRVGWSHTTLSYALAIWGSDCNRRDRLIELLNMDKITIHKAYRELESMGEVGSDSNDIDDEDDQDAAIADGALTSIEHSGQYRFTPVVDKMAPRLIAKIADNKNKIVDERYTWWRKNSLIKRFPWVFINPFTDATIPADKYDWRRQLGLDENVTVIADSGGFQLAKGNGQVVDDPAKHDFTECEIHPETLLEWQVKYADIGPILDVPPFFGVRDPKNYRDYSTWLSGEFESCLELTAEHTRRMRNRIQKLRSNCSENARDFIQLGVIQGQVPPKSEDIGVFDLIERWHTGIITESGPLDGWALSPKPSDDLFNVAAMLSYAATEFEDPDHIHVFQVGAVPHFILLSYFAKKTGFKVTSDAMSYQTKAQNGLFSRLNSAFSSTDIPIRDLLSNHGPMRSLPCRCPVCVQASADIKDFALLDNISKTELTHVFGFHNVNTAINHMTFITCLVDSYGDEIVDSIEIDANGELSVDDSNQLWTHLEHGINDRNRLIELFQALNAVKIAVESGRNSGDVQNLLRGGQPETIADASPLH